MAHVWLSAAKRADEWVVGVRMSATGERTCKEID
jgi:hypothetical protein